MRARKYKVYFREKVGDKFEAIEALDLSDEDFKAMLIDTLVEIGLLVGIKNEE